MMRKDFRLRSILRARKRALDTARGRLAEEIRERNHDQLAQEDNLTHLRDTSRQVHDRLIEGSSAGGLRAADAEMEAAYAEASAASRRVEARDASIVVAIEAITDARKRLRSLQILEARWQDRKRRERAIHEQKRLDEIANQPRRGLIS